LIWWCIPSQSMGSRETMHHDFLCRQSAWHYSIAADNVLFFEWFECPVAATLLNIHIFGPRRNERNDFPPFAPVGSPCFKIGNLFYTWLLPLPSFLGSAQLETVSWNSTIPRGREKQTRASSQGRGLRHRRTNKHDVRCLHERSHI